MILDDEDDYDDADDEPDSATSESRKPSNASSLLPADKSTSPSTEASASIKRPKPSRIRSTQSIKNDLSQSPRWNSLPKDVRYYLNFHREHMTHHHYAFKYDGGNFLKTTFLEIAMNDGSAALLYSIVAFAAYHHSVAYDDGKIPVFLGYYNKSIAFLQQSLKRQRHNVATLLTILQLATIEVKLILTTPFTSTL